MPPLACVGTVSAMSGTMFRLSSKRQRLSNTFCMSSVSTSASISPGSHVPGSWKTGKCSTCDDASAPVVVLVLVLPHAATASRPRTPSPTALMPNLFVSNLVPPSGSDATGDGDPDHALLARTEGHLDMKNRSVPPTVKPLLCNAIHPIGGSIGHDFTPMGERSSGGRRPRREKWPYPTQAYR